MPPAAWSKLPFELETLDVRLTRIREVRSHARGIRDEQLQVLVVSVVSGSIQPHFSAQRRQLEAELIRLDALGREARQASVRREDPLCVATTLEAFAVGRV